MHAMNSRRTVHAFEAPTHDRLHKLYYTDEEKNKKVEELLKKQNKKLRREDG